jgi:GNAT superfamily N-acetyltransferase
MGELSDVAPIRRAYVRTTAQGQSIGGQLLSHLRKLAKSRLLIGTWTGAIGFFEKHGFELLFPQK